MFYTKGGQRLSLTLPGAAPVGYEPLFVQTARAHWHSLNPRDPQRLGAMAPELVDLVMGHNRGAGLTPGVFWDAHPDGPQIPCDFDPDRRGVLLSGGKDSLHALLMLVEAGVPAKQIHAFHVPNFNRSESYHERKAVQRIVKRFGVSLDVAEVSNSIAGNRTGNAIGLRNQVMVCLVLPALIRRRCGVLETGSDSHFASESDSFLVYTELASSYAIYAGLLARLGAPVETRMHPLCEFEIIEDLAHRHRELFGLTSSCLTQPVFRESHHRHSVERFGERSVTNGCGVCIKCLRINGVLGLIDGNAALVQYVLRRKREKYPDDHTLEEIEKRA